MLDWIWHETPGDPVSPRHWTAEQDDMIYRIYEIITHSSPTQIKALYRLNIQDASGYVSANTYTSMKTCKAQATRLSNEVARIMAARKQDRGSD